MGICRQNAGQVARGQRFVRACAVEMHMDISHEPFCVEIYRGNAGRIARDQRFAGACAVEMDMDSSQEPSCGNLQGKSRLHRPRSAFSASRHNQNGHGQFTRAILCGNLKGKCRTRLPRHPFCASLGNRNTYRKNPSVWPSCLGNKSNLKHILPSFGQVHTTKGTQHKAGPTQVIPDKK